MPFRNFMPDFDFSLREERATCDNCLMARAAGGFAYKGNLKCCTFFPFLMNFQVGAILSGTPSEAQNKLRSFISTNQSQPLGVAPDESYQKKFIKRGFDGFGNDADLLCPYFDRSKGICGIWNWRGGVCTSFYCESSHGLKGIEWWRDIEKFFLSVERTLAYDAILHQGFDEEEAQACLKALPHGNLNVFHFRYQLWIEMNERREALYLKSYEYVMNLSHSEIQDLLGPELLSTQKTLNQRAKALLSMPKA